MKKNRVLMVFAFLLTAISSVKASNDTIAKVKIPPTPTVRVVNSCNYSVLSTTATGDLLWSTGETTPSITASLYGTYYVKTTINGHTSPQGAGIASPYRSPVLTTTPIIISATFNTCSASISFGPNVTSTGIPAPTLLYKIGTTVITSPRTFPVGTTIVTVIATNSCGSTTATFPVTVSDNQMPSVACKPAAKRSAATGGYSIAGSEFNATAGDNCGTPTLIYSLKGATVASYQPGNISLAGVKLNIGTTTITWKATDPSGNIATCNTTVAVTRSATVNMSTTSAVSSNFASGDMLTENKQVELEAIAMPNPASGYFTLKLKSQSQENLTIKVMDITGKMMEQKTGIPANSTLQFGCNYATGLYIAEICQGNHKIFMRLVKATN